MKEPTDLNSERCQGAMDCFEGTNFEIGNQHGRKYRESIIGLAQTRLNYCSLPYWTERETPRDEVLALSERCVDEHRSYSPALMEELDGIAAGTGLSLAELIVLNGFTDFREVVKTLGRRRTRSPRDVTVRPSNCTGVLAASAEDKPAEALFGQTWDMQPEAEGSVIALHAKPIGQPSVAMMSLQGCIGMIGMNDRGLSVGITDLEGRYGQIGVTWPFVVRKMLQQSSLDEAVKCLENVKLAGAHCYMILERGGRGCCIEAMPAGMHVERLSDRKLVHTNHCLWPKMKTIEAVPDDRWRLESSHRLRVARHRTRSHPFGFEALIDLLSNEDGVCINPSSQSDFSTCGAVVCVPSKMEFHYCLGNPSKNEFRKICL